MARRHIIYIPFAGGDPNWTVDWNTKNLHRPKSYEILRAGAANLNQLPWYSEIYIQGHGAAGRHTISDGGGVTLKYDALANLLIADGLKKTWSGTIKCLTCYSGVCTIGKQSFAAKLAQRMRKKGYLLISFVGYLGPVDAYPDQTYANSKYHHKYTTMFNREIKSKYTKAFF